MKWLIGRIACTFLIGSITLLTAHSLPNRKVRGKQIAGYKLLKVFDERNSAIEFRGVHVIFQDREGIFWIGSNSGLYRFDEKQNQWESFTKAGGELVSHSVFNIAQSRDGKLWFLGPYFSTNPVPNVSCFDGERWLDYKATFRNIFHQRAVSTIFPGRDGKVWFAYGNGIGCYDGQEWLSFLVPNDFDGLRNSRYIRSGVQDRDGLIWLQTLCDSTIQFDEASRKWTVIKIGLEKILPDVDVGCDILYKVFLDRQGRIWWGSLTGLGHHGVYDKRQDRWTLYAFRDLAVSKSLLKSNVGVFAIHQDKLGRVLLGTDKGLITLNESEDKWELFTPENSGLPDAKITSIFEDRNGRVWIGTNNSIVVLEP